MDKNFSENVMMVTWIGILREIVDGAIESGKSLDQIADGAGMTTNALVNRLNGRVKNISIREIAAILNATEHELTLRVTAHPRKY